VICALEIVGEACKKVPTVVRQRNPQVPWKEMAGMKDRLIHGYFGVDDEIISGRPPESSHLKSGWQSHQ